MTELDLVEYLLKDMIKENEVERTYAKYARVTVTSPLAVSYLNTLNRIGSQRNLYIISSVK